jgi:hypothetical protein
LLRFLAQDAMSCVDGGARLVRIDLCQCQPSKRKTSAKNIRTDFST